MHRHARPGALLIIFVLVLLTGAVSLAGPAALTSTAPSAVDLANIAPHPDDDKVAPAPAPVHLTVPTPSGLPAEAAQRPMAGPGSGGAHPRHHGPAAQETGTWQERAPPAIADR